MGASRGRAGLWEILWELRLEVDSDDSAEHIRVARRVIRDLLERDLVEAFLCTEPYSDFRPVDTSTAARLMADDASWTEPDRGSTSIRIAATDHGEAVYRSMPKREDLTAHRQSGPLFFQGVQTEPQAWLLEADQAPAVTAGWTVAGATVAPVPE